MKIALDAMGGDFAPRAAVEGAILASEEVAGDTELVLVGRAETIATILSEHAFLGNNIVIHDAPSVIEMAEHPTKALAQKPDSSIAIGFELLKSGKISAFCSAGNTGAMHVGAMFSIKPLEGVLRPALAGFVPKEDGSFGVILDIGANADCKPEVLDQFAEIGSLYAMHVLGIQNPKVGLLNLGEEEQKGTVLTQAAHQLLKNNTNINFIGNIEGRDLFNDKADVIVCDGFTGNIVLKMAESIYDLLKTRNFLDRFFEKFNYEAVGGSPILGVNGNVVIGHGTSGPVAVKNMLLMAHKMAQSNIYSKIGGAFGSPVPSHE